MNLLTKFDEAMIQSATEMEQENYDQAIVTISNAYKIEVSEENDDPDMKINCDLWVALILEKKKDFNKAIDIYENLVIPADHPDYLMTKMRIAEVKMHQNKHKEAIEILTNTTKESMFDALGDGLHLLKIYIQLINKETIKPEFIALINSISEVLQIDKFESNTSSKTNFKSSVETLWELQQLSSLAFSELRGKLRSAKNDSEKKKLISEYVNSESLGYYRTNANSLIP